MATTTDALSLKVHAIRDGIWCVRGESETERVADTVAEFLQCTEFTNSDTTCVRLVGTHSNAELVAALFDLKTRGRLESVQVVTPLVCATRAERRNPSAVLHRMRRFAQSPSNGGYHEVTDSDYVAYALAAEIFRQPGAALTDKAKRLLRMHPAWKPLRYIPTLDEQSAGHLLAQLLDPRWYTNPANPDGGGRMEAFLGLNPKTQDGVSLAGKRPWHRHAACALVMACWKQPTIIKQIRAAFELSGPKPVEGSDIPGLRPGDFPWRIWGYCNGIGPGAKTVPLNPVLADLRASQRFVAFLRQTWLNELYRGAALPDFGKPLFRATDFFRQHMVEAQGYDYHMLGAN